MREQTRSLLVGPEHGGLRLDAFVARSGLGVSRSQAERLAKFGQIRVNGQSARPGRRLAAGELVEVCLPPDTGDQGPTPEAIPLDILFEDDHVLVVSKPQEMVVHPGAGRKSGTLVNALLAHCKDLSGVGGQRRPGIVHRLDKDTSGLVVVAKNDIAHRHLQRQFKKRLVHKVYLALTEGCLPAARGVIDAPIGRDPKQRKRMAVVAHGGREARTEYCVLERFSQHTLAEAKPITGRTHQIRIHFAFIGHPVAGDHVYGFRKQRLSLRRQFLHAARIGFRLPSSGEAMEFTADLPHDLASVLDELRQSATRSPDSR